jgi:hypothetical protein
VAPWRIGLILGLLALGCGEEDGRGTFASGVRGVVRDADTGKGIGGAKVRFLSDTLDEDSDTTEKDGSYAVSALTDTPNGHLEVTKAGYAPRTVSVYLDSDDVSIDVELERD